MKATEQYFPVVLFIMLYKMVVSTIFIHRLKSQIKAVKNVIRFLGRRFISVSLLKGKLYKSDQIWLFTPLRRQKVGGLWFNTPENGFKLICSVHVSMPLR